MAQYAAKRLSKELKTKVVVKNVSFTLLNHVNLEGLYIEDRKQDTLLSAGEMNLNITDWFFLKDSANIKYVGLKDAVVYLQRTTDTAWNYQFMIDYFGGGKKTPKPKNPDDTTKKGITLDLKAVDLQNVRFEQRDKFHGNTTVLGIGNMLFRANHLDFPAKNFDIAELHFTKPKYATFSYKGLWSAADSIAWRRYKDALPPGGTFPENPGNIQLLVRKLTLKDGELELKSRNAKPSIKGQFNERDIAIEKLTGTFTNLRWNKDTLSSKMDFSANAREGLAIKRMQLDFTFHPKLMEFKNLDLELNESRLTDYFSMEFDSMDDFSDFTTKVKMTGNFKNTVISTNDVAFFAGSALRAQHQKATLNGFVSGPLSDMNAPKFRLQTTGTDVPGSLRITGLPDPDKMMIDFSTPGATLQFNDIAVWATALKDLDPALKNGLKTVKFKGSFKGLVDNFNLKGDLTTADGSLTTDLKMNLGKGKDLYDGKISTNNLNLGRLLNNPNLGKLNFNGTVKGKGFKNARLEFAGLMKSAYYNDYNYTNVDAKGILNGTVLNAHLDVDDPNLAGQMDATIDLASKKQTYIGSGNLSRANFLPLHFAKQNLQFSGAFDVNFSGRNIDDFLGYAKLRDAHLTNDSVPFSLDSLNVYSHINDAGKKELEVQTNEIDASVVGQFNIAELPNSFQYFLSNYYPSIIPKPKKAVKDQDFIFAINTKNIEDYLKLVDKKIEGFSNSNIIGAINTNDEQLMLNVTVPYFKYDNVQLTNTAIQGIGSLHRLDINGSLDNLQVSDSLSFAAVKLNVTTENNLSHVVINTNAEGQLGDATIDANFTTDDDGLKLKFNPSNFILNNKKWTITQDGEVMLRKNQQLVINNLGLKQDEQEIQIYTSPSSETNSNDIHINTKKLNIGDLMQYAIKTPKLEGMASGKFTVSDIFTKPHVSVDTLQMNEFRMDGDSIGILNVNGNLYTATGKGKFNVVSPNLLYNFDGVIGIDLKDSTGNQLNAPINFRHTRINLLNSYLNTIFDDIDGYATGQLLVRGKFSEPELIGDLRMDSGRIKVGFTKVTYFVDSATVSLKKDYIGFNNMKLRDRYNNTGTLTGGFSHHFFKDMAFDLKIASNRMELINTGAKDNQNFFGNAIGNGSFELTGPQNKMVIKIAAEPTDSSHISITSSISRESGEADYIIFKKYGREQVVPTLADNDLYIEVDLKANNKAQIDVILDAANGDVIRAVGNGRLKIINDKNGISMRGRYDIERGNYNYSFQSFIRKGFDLKGDGSNYIEWNGGDPTDATMNIDAVYRAINVRFSDLNGTDNRLNVGNFKGDINVVAELRGNLAKPNISFRLDFPDGSALKNAPSATLAIDNINNNQDKSELLKQVTYLIVFNQFAPYGEGKATRNPTVDLAVNTMSELLSREMGKILSNVLYQITGDRSLQVDFSTSVYNSTDISTGNVSASGGYDRTSVNFKLGKSFADNRIILNAGSDFDFSVRNNSAVSSFQFLPDVSLEFVLNANRKLRAIVFKKDNLELGSRQNRVGASISYRTDFDKLFGKKTDTIRIRRKDIPATEPPR